MRDRRIPQAIAEFNSYIKNTDSYLPSGGSPTNGERLGINGANISSWNLRRTQWEAIHSNYINPLTSTSAVKRQLRAAMREFREFAQPLINLMAASPNAIEADAATFNFAIGRKKPTRPKGAIEEAVVMAMRHLGGGSLKISCRTAHDDDKPSLPKRADSVQIAFGFLDVAEAAKVASIKFGDQALQKEIFTRPQFVFPAGVENIGKRIVFFARWYHTRHPNLAGPWSAAISAIVA